MRTRPGGGADRNAASRAAKALPSVSLCGILRVTWGCGGTRPLPAGRSLRALRVPGAKRPRQNIENMPSHFQEAVVRGNRRIGGRGVYSPPALWVSPYGPAPEAQPLSPNAAKRGGIGYGIQTINQLMTVGRRFFEHEYVNVSHSMVVELGRIDDTTSVAHEDRPRGRGCLPDS